jgi:hypothetical protein
MIPHARHCASALSSCQYYLLNEKVMLIIKRRSFQLGALAEVQANDHFK